MKIVIAPDSFKDSLSAADVADAIASGLKDVFPDAELVKCPMADGGEGTIDAILSAVAGELRSARVTGPLGEPVTARWGWLPESRTAIIEMAEASGLQLVATEQRNACSSSTEGTGELIIEALNAGAKKLILTIGGSATNDGGTGMLRALGARFMDSQGNLIPAGGLALSALASIDIQALDARLSDVRVEVAADVDNPLCGPHGASFTFARQKGADSEQIQLLDDALGHYADQCAALLNEDVRHVPGAGAAGGIGFAAKAFLQATFRPGVEVVAELTELANRLQGADLVITGEGRFDAQTLRGKTPLGVARIAGQCQVPVIVLAGTLGEGYAQLYAQGIDAAFALTSGPMTLQEACRQAPVLLKERARDIARLLCVAKRIG
ncbi:glycerate kinase [Pseudomonas sp. LS1212]|uniref:glycerate kinase n=1 Tax=Pseudomonas sp. LS1212 TaxID=2972478 RepID=UPI00215CE248|nr:glycerate kinase [Pseudomonas sp. LS1212]UVJ45628.1 glycerate kinase [Pseudomonas sp. LS1212]